MIFSNYIIKFDRELTVVNDILEHFRQAKAAKS
jgi:hypothetical protein